MTAVTDEALLRYLESRDRQRADNAAAFLATLTLAELDLVREGAYWGYALGYRFGLANPGLFRDVPYPHDVDIVGDAIAHSLKTIRLQQGRRDYWLFREAAVMGFVLGDRSGGVDARAGRPEVQPHAEHALLLVVEHCQSTSDLYPVIGQDRGDLARKILRNYDRPVPRASLAEALVMVLAEDADRINTVLADMVDDGEIVETVDGISLPEVTE